MSGGADDELCDDGSAVTMEVLDDGLGMHRAMKNYLIAERNMWLFNVLIPLHT